MMTLDGNVILLSHHNLTQIKSMDKNHPQNQPLGIEICRVCANQNAPLQPVNTPCITIGYLIAGHKYLYHNNEVTAIEQNRLGGRHGVWFCKYLALHKTLQASFRHHPQNPPQGGVKPPSRKTNAERRGLSLGIVFIVYTAEGEFHLIFPLS